MLFTCNYPRFRVNWTSNESANVFSNYNFRVNHTKILSDWFTYLFEYFGCTCNCTDWSAHSIMYCRPFPTRSRTVPKQSEVQVRSYRILHYLYWNHQWLKSKIRHNKYLTRDCKPENQWEFFTPFSSVNITWPKILYLLRHTLQILTSVARN